MSALPLDERAYQSARLSPDGRRIAVLVRERGFGSIWIYDTTRDTFTRLTTKEESVGSPLWSPDSRRLVFWSELHKGLFTIAVDGSDRSDRLTGSDVGTLYPSAWSPDGATIAFISPAPSLSLLAVLARPPYTVRQLATGAGAQVEGSFSPDGRWLTHISSERGVPEVVVGPAAGGRQWPIAPAGRWPTWTPDGRGVMYVDNGAIYRVEIESSSGEPIGRPAKVVELPRSTTTGGAIEMSSDGRRFLMIERVANDDRPAEIRVVQNWIAEVRAKMSAAAAASK
jgi:Tol biopolymer transport system component